MVALHLYVVCNAVCLAVFYLFVGLMKIQVKVEEVLMLLGLFMEVEAIPMKMRLVFILVVRATTDNRDRHKCIYRNI